MTAPLLVVAIGNASRGDDALGPALAAALRDAGWFDGGEVELLEAYQLQIEDALALVGRRAVLFVDAARRGAAAAALAPLVPSPGAQRPGAFTHAMAPAALLELCVRVLDVPPPPAWLLSIAGECFELGAPLSATARLRLARAQALAGAWLACRRNPSGAARRWPRPRSGIPGAQPSPGALPEGADEAGCAPARAAREPGAAAPGAPWPR
ncbi:MAG: hypothetical protein AMXMBFR66_36750 [Pseudomonadota bacterium]|nr:hydrogenase maturation protease [Rubrivivax sp.]NLZ42390.1 hydrogenase maturation protease [Comamonadaceae bacterium]